MTEKSDRPSDSLGPDQILSCSVRLKVFTEHLTFKCGCCKSSKINETWRDDLTRAAIAKMKIILQTHGLGVWECYISFQGGTCQDYERMGLWTNR